MISIPTIKYCLLVVGYGTCLVEWALGVVGLTCGVEVEGLKVYFWHGFPFFLGHTTTEWLHVSSSPTGTGSRTPRATSSLRLAFTSSCQWSSTEIGLWWGTGSASEFTMSRIGMPSMRGSC